LAATLDGSLILGRKGRRTTSSWQGRPKVAVAVQAGAGGVLFTLQHIFYGRFSSNFQDLLVTVAHHAVVTAND
jgi:hypothetical protein